MLIEILHIIIKYFRQYLGIITTPKNVVQNGPTTHTQAGFSENNIKYELLLHDNPDAPETYAINAIMQVCGHGVLQALQCAVLITNKGKTQVKVSTDKNYLIKLQQEFNVLGLGATISEYQ